MTDTDEIVRRTREPACGMKGGIRDLRRGALAAGGVLGLTGPAVPAWGGTTELVSVSSTGEQANGRSDSGSISPDGRFVAFTSSASNLVPGDTNGAHDIFVRDRQTG